MAGQHREPGGGHDPSDQRENAPTAGDRLQTIQVGLARAANKLSPKRVLAGILATGALTLAACNPNVTAVPKDEYPRSPEPSVSGPATPGESQSPDQGSTSSAEPSPEASASPDINDLDPLEAARLEWAGKREAAVAKYKPLPPDVFAGLPPGERNEVAVAVAMEAGNTPNHPLFIDVQQNNPFYAKPEDTAQKALDRWDTMRRLAQTPLPGDEEIDLRVAVMTGSAAFQKSAAHPEEPGWPRQDDTESLNPSLSTRHNLITKIEKLRNTGGDITPLHEIDKATEGTITIVDQDGEKQRVPGYAITYFTEGPANPWGPATHRVELGLLPTSSIQYHDGSHEQLYAWQLIGSGDFEEAK